MCMGIEMALIGKIATGLSIAQGVASTLQNINQAQAQVDRDAESQILQLRNYQAEREARDRDARHQRTQLMNQEIETKENAEDAKGDIALAAQKAASKLAASQASSGLQVGQGTFGSVLQSVGFESARDQADVNANTRNRMMQIETERDGVDAANNVPAPYLPEIAPVNKGMMLLGGGLQIASGVATNINKWGKLRSDGNPWFAGRDRE